MFYAGMPDFYELEDDKFLCEVFWYEGEFWLTIKRKYSDSRDTLKHLDTEYYEDVNELLLRMLEIAPYKDWRNVSQEAVR